MFGVPGLLLADTTKYNTDFHNRKISVKFSESLSSRTANDTINSCNECRVWLTAPHDCSGRREICNDFSVFLRIAYITGHRSGQFENSLAIGTYSAKAAGADIRALQGTWLQSYYDLQRGAVVFQSGHDTKALIASTTRSFVCWFKTLPEQYRNKHGVCPKVQVAANKM